MFKSEIFSLVRAYGDRPDLDDTELDALLSVATGRLNVDLRDHPRMHKRASLALPLNASGPLDVVPLPEDIQALVSLFDQAGNRYEQVSPAGSKKPEFWYVDQGNCLQVGPEFVAYTTFLLDYRALLLPPTDTTQNWVSEWFPNVYTERLLAELGYYTRDGAMASVWEGRYAASLASLVAQGWNQNIAAGARL